MTMTRLRRYIPLALLMSLCISTVQAGVAPEVQLKTAQGAMSLQELRGQVVYVDFWASWCGPCRKSFPWMNAMQQRYGKDGFTIVAINVDSDPALARQFLSDNKAGFTIAYDHEGVIARQFKVMAMPSSYLIDRDGNVHATHLGFREHEAPELERTIKTLLAR